MKITVLETNMLTKGDICLDKLNNLGKVTYLDCIKPNEIIEKCIDDEIILCSKTIFNKELIDCLPKLKLICVFATGYNNVDTKYAAKKGITVVNVPGYSTESVVQHVFTLLLTLAGSTNKYVESTSKGDWINSPTFTYFPYNFSEISGKTLGIVGYGTIGSRVAEVGNAFGMKVIVHSRTPKENCPYEQVSLETLLKKCDFLSLNCPLTEKTKEMINKDALSLMKSTAYIINTSRGPVINEQDLADALHNGKIAGAALDVLTVEPMEKDCPLFGEKNCIITPHIAWTTYDARQRLADICADNVKAYIDGNPINTVN